MSIVYVPISLFGNKYIISHLGFSQQYCIWDRNRFSSKYQANSQPIQQKQNYVALSGNQAWLE